jgi:hypothetical protein
MIRRPAGSGASGGGVGGIFSFVGVFLIVLAVWARALDAQLGMVAACLLGALAGAAAWWAAYRTRRWWGAIAGIGLAAAAGYSLYALNQASGGSAGWFWPAVVSALVGLDQLGMKRKG